ncbi:MAG: glycine--tRNA ligase subunit beta [Alphaproteobacteria bacterium]|nr:glycine--tRNA ligase subunit beta [Alphaproteobacteria bacterium]
MQLLLELLSEEIPARMQPRAGEDLKRLVSEALTVAGVGFDAATAYAGPRRIALVVDGLPESQKDTVEERRGPRADAPMQAVQGFAGSLGIPPIQGKQIHDADLGSKPGEKIEFDNIIFESRTTENGKFYFSVVERKGCKTIDVLGGLLGDVIKKMTWPKSMRWGNGQLRWVRPLKGILALLDGDVVPFAIDTVAPDVEFDPSMGSLEDSYSKDYQEKFGTIVAGNQTRGHRFHSPDAFEVGFFKDYAATLHRNKVIVDAAERSAIIREDAKKLAEDAGFRLRRDHPLRAEVAGLVEWPVCLMGRIDPAYMALPDEVLITSMRTHQKYFAVETADGRLAPHFVVVANIEAADGGAAIVAGNERVLRARLADAKFFWDQDRKVTLEDRVAALADVVFHAKLGTLAEKVARVEELASGLIVHVPGAELEPVRRAATLAKADLTTAMVGEFPELQGVMGRYYALEENEPPEVAEAVARHYSPTGAGDDCPTAPVTVAVALADRLDTLAGFWAIGETPTGSRDPYALRRAALGVIRLVLENRLRLPLREAFAEALRRYPEAVRAGRDAEIVDGLLEFFIDRMKVHLRDKGVRHDLVAAVFALDGQDDLRLIVDRVEALQDFLEGEDGRNLLSAYRRAANIVAIEEKKDGRAYDGDVRADLLQQAEESTFYRHVDEVLSAAAEAMSAEDFRGAMTSMATLRGPVDAFFDKVTVNADDPALRENRLMLLSRFRSALNRVADFSRIEGRQE